MSFQVEYVRQKNYKPCVFKRIANKNVKMKEMTSLFEWLRHITNILSFIPLNLNKCIVYVWAKTLKTKKNIFVIKKLGHLSFNNLREIPLSKWGETLRGD